MVTKAWKVYGAPGHRQRESFAPSSHYDFSNDNGTRIIETLNSDITTTNEYSIIQITMNTPEECDRELDGQLFDGVFENYNFGAVVEIDPVGIPLKSFSRRYPE